jgi:hypothetical protein
MIFTPLSTYSPRANNSKHQFFKEILFQLIHTLMQTVPCQRMGTVYSRKNRFAIFMTYCVFTVQINRVYHNSFTA